MKQMSWCLALLAALAAAMVFSGCGGGGASSLATGGGTIRGTIGVPALGSSRAAGDVTISVDGTNISTTVAPGGEFVLQNVPPGIHTLVADFNGQAAALVAEVAGKSETNVGEVTLTNAGQIAGIVSAADTKQPLAGATITVSETVQTTTTNEMPHPVRAIRTDGSGSYTVRALPVGDYLVTTALKGYATASVVFTVTAQTTTPGDIALTPQAVATGAGNISGAAALQAADGLHPLAGVLVRLAPTSNAADPSLEDPLPATVVKDGQLYALLPNSTTPQPLPSTMIPREYYAYTAADGTYTIANVPAGDYAAAAILPGMVSPAPQTVAIKANATTTANFTLTLRQPSYGIIQGTVTSSADNTPLQGANVRAIWNVTAAPGRSRPAAVSSASAVIAPPASGAGALLEPSSQTNASVVESTTDKNGKYQLIVPPTFTAINVSAANFTPTQVAVTITAGATVTQNVALAPQAVSTLSGTVTDANTNMPIQGATVQADYPVQYANLNTGAVVSSVTLPPTPGPRTAQTDALGHYSLTVPPGTFPIYLSATGYQQATKTATVTPGEAQTQDVALTPRAYGSISGMVTDAQTDAPIAGVTIIPDYARDANTTGATILPSPSPWSTDAAGAFTLTQLQPGPITLTFAKDGYRANTLTFTVTANTTLPITVALSPLPQPATVTGTVTDKVTGAPIVGAVVSIDPLYAQTTAAGTLGVAKTDANGVYTMKAPYWVTTLYVAAAGYTRTTVTVQLTGGGTLTQSITLVPHT